MKLWGNNLFNKIFNKFKKNKKPDVVYIITMIPIIVQNKYTEGLLAEGCWTVGIYDDYKTACSILENNTTDLWKTMYHYGIIEEVNLNQLYPCFSTNWTEWYAYNKKTNKYQPTEIPVSMENSVGFWG